MKVRYFKIISFVVFFLLVFILAISLFAQLKANEDPVNKDTNTKNKQYVCSMHPQVLRDGPGDCPICGMFLIELIEKDQNSFDSSLTDVVLSVNESVLGHLKNVAPEQKALPVIIESSGIINFDPGKITVISARFGGYIERTLIRNQFQHVAKGQKIYEIYSPDIYTKRWNYVTLIRAFPDRADVTREALEWFNILGLSEGQVDSLKCAKIPDYHLAVYSQSEGYAVSRDFNRGSIDNQGTFIDETRLTGFNDGITVETGTPLFNLIDIKSLRADLKVKTEDASLLKKGQEVILTEEGYPDNRFIASIDQIEPFTSGPFQIVKVFLKIQNRRELLLPGKKINARIFTGIHDGLWLPVTAVVGTGRHNCVFIMKGNKYVATEVRTGVRSNDEIEILYGIDQNTMVAEKALLLIDSDGFIKN